MDAAVELWTEERAPTQLELAERAQVGYKAARLTVQNMVRGGALCIVRLRPVDYRSRPVAEYCPAKWLQRQPLETRELHRVFATWQTGAAV